MTRLTIWTLALSIALPSAAAAGTTAQQKCEASKVTALANRTACRAGPFAPGPAARDEAIGRADSAADSAF